MNRLDVTYERACMATQEEEYYTGLLETMLEHNDRTKTPLSKEKLQQEINIIVEETEEGKLNANNVTTDTFIHPPVTTNIPSEKTDVANERQVCSDIMTETIKLFNTLTLQSTINDSADDHLYKNVAKIDPKIDTLVDTHTSDRRKGKIH